MLLLLLLMMHANTKISTKMLCAVDYVWVGIGFGHLSVKMMHKNKNDPTVDTTHVYVTVVTIMADRGQTQMALCWTGSNLDR